MSEAEELAPWVHQPLLNKRWLSVCVIVFVYLGLVFSASPDAYLSTDVGGKTASLEAMDSRGDWNLDIGYWLEDSDEQGDLYPLAHTRRTPNGQWVNTTSLPMVYAAKPLWALGGPRFGLLLPLLGGVASALVAGSIATRIRPDANGVLATWLVGLAGPVLVYAFDFWEHTLGLAAMGFGVLMVMDALVADPSGSDRPQRRWRSFAGSGVALSALAGLSYGAASTMRQEALVYGFVGGLVLLIGSWRSWGITTSVKRGTAMVVGAAVPMAVHSIAEIYLFGGIHRLERSATITEEPASLVDRLTSAAATSTFPFNGFHLISYIGGAMLAVSLIWAATTLMTGRGSRLASVAALVVWCAIGVFLVMLGPRFVPGLIPTTPLAVLGAVSLTYFRKWIPLALGLAPVPLLFATQYPAGAIPQWGGRYMLLTGLVLMSAAVALLQTRRHQQLLGLVAVAGCAITVFGASWGLIRMNTVAAEWVAIEQLADADEVVVWRDPSIAREAGPLSVGQRWVGAPSTAKQQLANEIFTAIEIEQFVWIDWSGGEDPTFAGYYKGEQLEGLTLLDQRIVRYHRLGTGSDLGSE